VPSTRVETVEGWLGDRRAAFLEAVQAALVEGILIPAGDRDVRLVEYGRDSVIQHPGASPRRTIVEVTLFSGRSLEAKKRLYSALVSHLAPFGLSAGDIKVILIEVPRENWGLGGKPASEIDLGFKVDV
jgi:phenylpyruvate tautomerase PptA (4-oxalocrotonate tautomerase family)